MCPAFRFSQGAFAENCRQKFFLAYHQLVVAVTISVKGNRRILFWNTSKKEGKNLSYVALYILHTSIFAHHNIRVRMRYWAHHFNNGGWSFHVNPFPWYFPVFFPYASFMDIPMGCNFLMAYFFDASASRVHFCEHCKTFRFEAFWWHDLPKAYL